MSELKTQLLRWLQPRPQGILSLFDMKTASKRGKTSWGRGCIGLYVGWCHHISVHAGDEVHIFPVKGLTRIQMPLPKFGTGMSPVDDIIGWKPYFLWE